MPKALATASVDQYLRQGYTSPVPVLGQGRGGGSPLPTRGVRDGAGGTLRPEQRNKAHLLLKWLDDLIRDSRVLDPVEDLIGPDILCWNHDLLDQGTAYGEPCVLASGHPVLGIADGNVVTCWLALSPATRESGCMKVLPGSHLRPMAHEDRYGADNMLTRGQEIVDAIDDGDAVLMPLRPGEMSVHDVRTAHASPPNLSGDRRIGVSMHFMPPTTKQSLADWDSAALVRGRDPFGHFHRTPTPQCDLDPAVAPFHERASAATRAIVYHGAEHNTARL